VPAEGFLKQLLSAEPSKPFPRVDASSEFRNQHLRLSACRAIWLLCRVGGLYIMAILKAALRGVHGVKTIEENFSGYYLADELSGIYQDMMIAFSAAHWIILPVDTKQTHKHPAEARG
jgi:hypothetical protein